MENSYREIIEYMKSLGEHINLIYERLKKIEAKMAELSGEMGHVKELSSADRKGFNDFVNKLTEGLKEIVPPIPQETEEVVEEADEEETEEVIEEVVEDESKEETESSIKDQEKFRSYKFLDS